ncbi:rab family small GTPase [Naegleria gruberi]|uniref:Rab family small GTPase n=1 Tax=Naegleria gruberi TaxID=5762 RepID=D2VZR2_NAEGR|nr:rab family small GTPase [Naegleria gruberi]EFC37702.1 rab family small GTPase [Naegleria gruberi]|eukprot:XP_002670446.1 rab family small GTPase [Naegleria gruberi strain NEG-M]
MGQSQPSYPASTPPCNCDDKHNVRESVIKKIGNVRMVPIDIFQTLLEQEEKNDENLIDLFNEENCSIYEKELPHELFIHILGYLTGSEIVKLGRTCKNFQNSFKRSDEKQIKAFTKTVLLGPEGSGKSEIVARIVGKDFDPTYTPTIGVEFAMVPYQLSTGINVKMQYWDASGKPTFNSLSRAYTRGVHVIGFCFDLNNEESFSEMKNRVEIYRNENFSNLKWNANLKEENAHLLILGMKRDLERKVSIQQVKEYISELIQVKKEGILLKDLRIQYFELSNKTDTIEMIEFPFMYGVLQVEDKLAVESPPQPVHGNLPAKK